MKKIKNTACVIILQLGFCALVVLNFTFDCGLMGSKLILFMFTELINIAYCQKRGETKRQGPA